MRGQEIYPGAQRTYNAELLFRRMRKHDPPVDPDGAGTEDYVDFLGMGVRRMRMEDLD